MLRLIQIRYSAAEYVRIALPLSKQFVAPWILDSTHPKQFALIGPVRSEVMLDLYPLRHIKAMEQIIGAFPFIRLARDVSTAQRSAHAQ